MCGLTGFYTPNSTRSKIEQRVIGQKMADCIAHRGPDHSEIWQDPDVPLLLAHRRLSILDLTPEGHQPMASESGRFMVVYNGEIYNFKTLRSELEAQGYNFKGRSDTETLLTAIEHWGLNQALQKIAGMFAFVLWDRKERELHFIRDRLGKKPLYIGWAGQGQNAELIFGSELKSLRKHPELNAAINKDVLGMYTRFGAINAPHCIYENIWQLPPGHRLSLKTENLKNGENLSALMRPYWDAAEQMKIAHSNIKREREEDILEQFEELLSTCVQERMISDVPLGAFLSGGIDSSLITAMMQKTSDQPVKTYSIGFHEGNYNEAGFAKKIAVHLGTDHHELYLNGQDALNVIPSLPDMYDEPFADQSAVPTYLLSKFVRGDVTVALSGDGGDELMGGYTRHVQGPKICRMMNKIPAPCRGIASGFMQAVPAKMWQALKPSHPNFGKHVHKAASFLNLLGDKDVYERMLSRWDNPPLTEEGALDLNLPDAPYAQLAEKFILWDTLFFLPASVLTKVDRASMACSLEVRAPLLDHRLFEYAWSLPLSMKIRDGKGKYLLRKLLHRHIPENLYERPKQGFNIPLEDWLQNDLRDWGEELLSKKTLEEQGLLNVEKIRNLWGDIQKGRQTHQTDAIWAILMFQAWHKRWM